MKLLIQFIALFCCQFIFAQGSERVSEQKFKQDSINLRSLSLDQYISDSASATDKTKEIENKKPSFDTKTDTEKSIATQNIDIIKEINAVLNYKINRIWRRDLYCLVCENFDAGKAA